MALIIPDSFDFEGADWAHPDPFDSRYWNALYEAIRERFTRSRGHLELRPPLLQDEAVTSDLPHQIAEILKGYIACENLHAFCNPYFYDTGTFEFPQFPSQFRWGADFESWSIPAMEQKIGKVPVPEILPALPIDSAEFLIYAKKALELLTIQEVSLMAYRTQRWTRIYTSAYVSWHWQDLLSGSYDWPTFWDLAVARFQSELPSLQTVSTYEHEAGYLDVPYSSNVQAYFTHGFYFGEPDHRISFSFEMTLPEVEFCEKINGRDYRPGIFAKNEGDLPIYLPEISSEKRIFTLAGKKQSFGDPDFDLSAVWERPKEPLDSGVIFSRSADLTFGNAFADFRTDGGYRFR